MFKPETLITGCALVDLNSMRRVWGDLWQLGDTYIFNATLNEFRDTNWGPLPPTGEGRPERALVMPAPAEFFDRRGVIVVAKSGTYFNLVAQAYLGIKQQ